MQGASARNIERVVVTAAAAAFAGAVAFATFRSLERFVSEPGLGGLTAGAMTFGYLLCGRMLDRVDASEPKFNVPLFDLGAIKPADADELVLTDADRIEPVQQPGPGEEPLELDDILHEVAPDARVVQLFDPAAMPTPGQLKARIDRHLGDRPAPAGCPDASQALVDALAELRQSLR